MDQVKITLFRTRLRVQKSNEQSFAEYTIPLAEHSPSLTTERDFPVAFLFNHTRLLRIVRRFPEQMETVEFTYLPTTQTLTFHTEDPEDPPTISRFRDYRHLIPPNPHRLGPVNPVVLGHAVSYAAVFAQENETTAALNMIELRGGTMYGGTRLHMGAMDLAELRGLDLKIKFDFIKPLEQMLTRFNAGATYLYETEQFIILRDESLFYGFARYSFSFPHIEDMYQHPSDNHVLVPRNQLSTSLALLAAVLNHEDRLVEVSVTGEAMDARLNLITREPSGKPCRDYLRVRRQVNPDHKKSAFPAWHFYVDLAVWQKLVDEFDSTNVTLEVLNNKVHFVRDTKGPLNARSLLDFLTPAQVRTLAEQNAQAARAVRRGH